MNLILDAKNRQVIRGQVKADVKVVRTVSGLTLPVQCYLNQGTYVGSCVYNDLCDFMKNFLKLDENDCPQSFIDFGIPCKCPFDLPIIELNINHIFQYLPSVAETSLWFIYSGDFDVTIKGTIGTTNILCLNMKFAMKQI